MQEAVDNLRADLEDDVSVSGASRIGLSLSGVSGALDYANLEAASVVDDAFEGIFNDLNATSGIGGAGKIKFQPSNVTPPVLTASSDWPNTLGSTQSLNETIESMMEDLGRTTSVPNSGSSMIGHQNSQSWRDATSISAGSLEVWLSNLVIKLSGDNGGQALGLNDLVTDSAGVTHTNNHRIDRSSGIESVEDFCHGNQTEITNRVVQKINDVETPAGVDVSNIANWSESHSPNVGEPNLLIEAQIASGVYARMYVDAKVGFLFTVNAKMQHASNVWARDDNALGSNVFGGLPNLDAAGPVGTGNNMGYAHRPGADTDTWTSANWAAGTGEFISFDVSAGVGTIDLPGGSLDGTET